MDVFVIIRRGTVSETLNDHNVWQDTLISAYDPNSESSQRDGGRGVQGYARKPTDSIRKVRFLIMTPIRNVRFLIMTPIRNVRFLIMTPFRKARD